MLAPIALFAYKRPDHLAATLQALMRNNLVEQTDLFVFSDGPRSSADIAAIETVRNIVRRCEGFSSVSLIEREHNFGLAKSIITGVSSLLERFECVIVLEDDHVTSANFIAYMNSALSHYRIDPHAFSVTAFSYPTKYFHIPEEYDFDTFAAYRCCSNSWGTWRDRWQRVDWRMRYFSSFSRDIDAQRAFNRGGKDLSAMLEMQYNGQIDSWAIRFCYAHFVNSMHCIYPIKTLLKDIGLDNSGTHSAPNPRYDHHELNDAWLPTRFSPADTLDAQIMASFHTVFDPHCPGSKEIVQTRVRNLFDSAQKKFKILQSLAQRIFIRPLREVDILFVNTYQSYGGAARAAFRIFQGVRKHRPSIQLLNLFRHDAEPYIFGLSPTTVRGACARHLINRDVSAVVVYPRRRNSYFSPAIHANPFRIRLSRFRPKLAHLHWVGHSMLSVEEIGQLQCPIVWTLHDAWAFTGGCHIVGTCRGFTRRCGGCPQLGSTTDNDLSRVVFERKVRAFEGLNMTIVTPSRWLADLASKSSLLTGRKIVVIPNGLDTSAFKPMNKLMARDYFGVPREHPVILFGAHSLGDPNKGADLLIAALEEFGAVCTLLTFGEGAIPTGRLKNVQLHALGNLVDDASLALAYSAADVFLCPSRQDNLPNTVAEALACGTPCAAFRIGGLPEMIDHQVNGWLADPFDPVHLAEGIAWLTQHPHPEELRHSARAKAEAEYDLNVISERYLRLYKEIQSGDTRRNVVISDATQSAPLLEKKS